MNTDKLKQMYASGGLLRAILKDPKMRQMASEMLSSEGGTKKYSVGGKMYANGGDVDPDEPKATDPSKFKTRLAGVVPSDEEIYAAVQEVVGGSLTESGMTPQEYLAAGYLGDQWNRVLNTAQEMAYNNFRSQMTEMDNRLKNKPSYQMEWQRHPGKTMGYLQEQVAKNYPEGSVMFWQNPGLPEEYPGNEEFGKLFDRAAVDYDYASADRLNALLPAEYQVTDEQLAKFKNQNIPNYPRRNPEAVGFMGSSPDRYLGPR